MLTFTEAIVLEKLADDAKATHEEVAYQDRPNDDQQCSRCWKYRPALADGTDRGSAPHCLKVQDPISPTGWCRRFEIHPDITSFLDIAKGADDQPRDDHGRWTSGSSGGKDVHAGMVRAKIESTSNKVLEAHDSFRSELGELRSAEKSVADKERQLASAKTDEDREDAEYELQNARGRLSDQQKSLQEEADKLHAHLSRLVENSSAALKDLSLKMRKAMNVAKGADDQPRDDNGRFASAGGGGDATHPDFMEGHEGSSVAQGMEQVPSGIHDSADAIDSAREELSSVSDTANDVADEEDDILEEHGPESKEYADWEQRNGKAMEDVADATMKLHAAVTDHLEATLNVHQKLTEIVNRHAKESGPRMKKAMEKAKDDGTPVYIVRHGATKLNNHDDTSRDRIRAWSDVPLSEDGRAEAKDAGEKLKKKVDVEAIIASDLCRAEETADIIGKIVDIKPTYSKKLRPWDLGDLTGTATKEALPKIAKYVEETPDEAVPGGESFNDFKARAFEGIAEAIAAHKGKNLVLVTHHRVERLIKAWIKAGQPASHDIDLKEFLKKGDPPGGFDIVHLDEKALAGKPVKKQSPGAGDVHATTALGNEGKRKAKDFLTTIAEIKGGARIVAVPDTVGDADVGKEAPPSLKMMDETMAHSPFPHDAHALHNMRPDQVPRFLGALTDQDRLETRTVRLGSLVAMQDRVDPAKVQSMRDTPPGKPPLVIRAGGRNIIADGHHRLAAMHLDGHKTAEVKYMDLSPVDNAVKRYRAVKACPECGVGAGAYHKIGCSGHVLGDVGKHEQLATVTEDCPECGAEKGYFHKRDCQNHGKNTLRQALRSDGAEVDIDIPFDVIKVEDDKQLVFGWASISSIGGENVVDKQDDIIEEEELEKAAYDFVLYSRKQGDLHEREGVGRLVESMVFTKQKQDVLGIDLGLVGWFVGFRVDAPDVWKRIKAGELPEFSIGGKAERVPA